MRIVLLMIGALVMVVGALWGRMAPPPPPGIFEIIAPGGETLATYVVPAGGHVRVGVAYLPREPTAPPRP